MAESETESGFESARVTRFLFNIIRSLSLSFFFFVCLRTIKFSRVFSQNLSLSSVVEKKLYSCVCLGVILLRGVHVRGFCEGSFLTSITRRVSRRRGAEKVVFGLVVVFVGIAE